MTIWTCHLPLQTVTKIEIPTKKRQGVSRSNTILAWIVECFTLRRTNSFHTNAYTSQKSNNIKFQRVKNGNCWTLKKSSLRLQLTPIHVIWRNWHAQIASASGEINHGFPATFWVQRFSTQSRGIGVNNETHHLSIIINTRARRNVHLFYCILIWCCWLLHRHKREPLAGSSVCMFGLFLRSALLQVQTREIENMSVLICWPPNLVCVKIASRWIWPFSGFFCPGTRRLKSRGVMSTAAPKMTPQLALHNRCLIIFVAHLNNRIMEFCLDIPTTTSQQQNWQPKIVENSASKISPIRLRFWAR